MGAGVSTYDNPSIENDTKDLHYGTLNNSSHLSGLVSKFLAEYPLNEVLWLSGHGDGLVRSIITLSNDMFVSGGDDGNILLWNSKNYEYCIFTPKHTGCITSMCLLHEEYDVKTKSFIARIASGSSDRTIKIWEIRKDKDLLSINMVCECIGHNGAILCIEVIQFNDILFCSGGSDGILIFWSNKGKKIGFIERHDNNERLKSLCYVSGDRIVTASSSKNLCLYSISNKCFIATLCEHKESVNVLRSFDNGNQFVSGGMDGKIVIWRANNDDVSVVHVINNRSSHEYIVNGSFIYSIKHILPLLNENVILASCGSGFEIISCSTGESLCRNYIIHKAPISGVISLYKDNVIVTSSEDSFIKLWKLEGLPNNPQDWNERMKLRVFRFGTQSLHSGSVYTLRKIDDKSFVSVGSDGMIVFCKDELVDQEQKCIGLQKYLADTNSKFSDLSKTGFNFTDFPGVLKHYPRIHSSFDEMASSDSFASITPHHTQNKSQELSYIDMDDDLEAGELNLVIPY